MEYKVPRIPTSLPKLPGKAYIPEEEVKTLLSDEVVVEEKLDGQQRWFDIGNLRIYYEDMSEVRKIRYESLPSEVIAFDVYDFRTGSFLDYERKIEVLESLGMVLVPLLFRGRLESPEDALKFLREPSAFGAPLVEGVVIKNYKKQLFGKIVNPDFDE